MNPQSLVHQRSRNGIENLKRNGPTSTLPLHGVFTEMHELAEETGLPFICVDAIRGETLDRSSPTVLPILPPESHIRLHKLDRLTVEEFSSGLVICAVPMASVDGRTVVAIGYAFARPGIRPECAVVAAADEGWTANQFNAWLDDQKCCDVRLVRSLLTAVVGNRERVDRELQAEDEIEQLTDQIHQTYEEISFLHSLTNNLQISCSPVDLGKLCLDRMDDLLGVDGNVIWIESRKAEPQWLVSGRIPFDEVGMARLVARFENYEWSRPLVKNNVEGTLLGADFPGLKGFVAVPIAEGEYRYGWIISCNLSSGLEFGTVEASLLNSIATIFGTHLRNIDLYQQHADLLVSFVRSLVSTLDAKDPYTRGHSERVALIARRIGQELGLPAEDLHDLHLSGLLHDIGKIGVDDRILRKPGKLTDEEFKRIQEHPSIGFAILSELKNLSKVLPGVRNHHEAYNGTGYPDRLRGDDIPLMARILAVADSYDAMGSDRPYRKGMPVESIENIFRRGAGDQWDERIIDAYFLARTDIEDICRNWSVDRGYLANRDRE